MVSACEIRAQLADWLADRQSLDQFEEWFVAATWEIHKSGDAEAEALTDEIELRLSEYSDGYLATDDLKQELSSLAGTSTPPLAR